MPRAAGGPGPISPSSRSRPRAERAPAEPRFLLQPGRSRDASPGLSKRLPRSPAGAGRPLFPKVAEARLPTRVSAQLANGAAAVAVAGFSMWCVPSLTHSSSHSQTFSIRAHSSLPGFFKRLEISSGGLRCHPNGNRSASRKGWSKKPHARSHGQATRDTSSEQKKLTPQKEKRDIINKNGDIINILRVRKL